MKSQACEPCAKRKVRCDKEEPCQNCKRRKQDTCTYPEPTPFDRIKKLEALVRDLGGDPESDETRPSDQAREVLPRDSQVTTRLADSRNGDPVMIEEDGQRYYLESREWRGWLGESQQNGAVRGGTTPGNPWLIRQLPSVMSRVIYRTDRLDFRMRYPSREKAFFLFDTFKQRVNPLLRISFEWELERLNLAASQPEHQLTDSEHAFVFALYFISVLSLSDDECKLELSQSRSSLLSEYQGLCEEALSRVGIFSLPDIVAIKAVAMYLMANIERASTQSLWSLMGLVIRNAERLGIHRDGTFLKLPPAETEDRRRLWWQLQHLDLALSVRSGMTSLTLMADWDVALPLNIEDTDISPAMTEFPKERPGLTSGSYCYMTYWIVQQQREFFHSGKGRFELSWQSNRSLMPSLKTTLINQIEEGLNKKFLQYCDPIRPIDILIQLVARALICGMRLRILHANILSSDGKLSEDHREEIHNACMQSLEYVIAMHSHPSLRIFQWWAKGFFQWQAFMFVLVEASHQSNAVKLQRIWDLIGQMYTSIPSLSQLSEDRRAAHAATLVVSAWKTRQSRFGGTSCPPKPKFVSHLETLLSEDRLVVDKSSTGENTLQRDVDGQLAQPFDLDGFLAEQNFDDIFNLDFQDIDWSMWNSID